MWFNAKTPAEIDWSRPQLVRNKHINLIVRTTGEHDDELFTGEVHPSDGNHYADMVGVQKDDFVKVNFKYHGGIPQEQPAKQKAAGLNFLEAISTCGGNLIRRPDNAIYGFDNDRCLRMMTYNAPDDRYAWPLPALDANDFSATDWQIVKS